MIALPAPVLTPGCGRRVVGGARATKLAEDPAALTEKLQLSNLFGNPVETGLCAAVMDAYPNLKVLLAHGGGVPPWLRGRFNRGFHVRPETRGKLQKAPR